MARVQNTLIGRASGSVGQVEFLTYRLINIIRSKPTSIANPNTTLQQIYRYKYGFLVGLYNACKFVIDAGLNNTFRKQTALNYFLKQNIKNVFTVVPPSSIMFDPNKLRISTGTLYPTPISYIYASYHSGTVEVYFDSGSYINGQSGGDIPFVICYNETQNLWACNSEYTRDDLQCNVTFSNTNNPSDIIHAWLFFKSAINGSYSVNTHSSFQLPPAIDPSTQAWIDAIGYVSEYTQNAINIWVIGAKNYGIWSKLKAVYPFATYTAYGDKFNLVNPVDSDAAFRLTYNGTLQIQVVGTRSNGTTGYLNTHFIPSLHTSADNFSIGFYAYDNGVLGDFDFGCMQSDFNIRALLSLNYSSNNTDWDCWNYTSDGRLKVANGGEVRGLTVGNRLSSTVNELYRNGIKIGTHTGASIGTRPNIPLYLLGNNYNNSLLYPTTRYCSFAFIGEGLTAEDNLNLWNLTQTLAETLQRSPF